MATQRDTGDRTCARLPAGRHREGDSIRRQRHGAKRGWVSVGKSHDTAEFAVASIRRWWTSMGSALIERSQSIAAKDLRGLRSAPLPSKPAVMTLDPMRDRSSTAQQRGRIVISIPSVSAQCPAVCQRRVDEARLVLVAWRPGLAGRQLRWQIAPVLLSSISLGAASR